MPQDASAARKAATYHARLPGGASAAAEVRSVRAARAGTRMQDLFVSSHLRSFSGLLWLRLCATTTTKYLEEDQSMLGPVS